MPASPPRALLFDMGGKGYSSGCAVVAVALRKKCVCSSFGAWEFVISPRSGDTPSSPPVMRSVNHARSKLIQAKKRFLREKSGSRQKILLILSKKPASPRPRNPWLH